MSWVLLPHSTYFIRQFLVFVLFVDIVLARFCVFGTAMSIKKVLFVFLFINYYYYYYKKAVTERGREGPDRE